MGKPRKRIPEPRMPIEGEASILDNPETRAYIWEMAFNGYFDCEIAGKLGVAKSTFCVKKQQDNEFGELLKSARARAKEENPDIPSVAMFREVWQKCDGKRSKLMEQFKIGWSTLQSWLAQVPAFNDIIAERDLPFLEQIDLAARIEALGAVKDKDNFPGWSRRPDMWQIRWYLNTLGKRYGYGENPVMPEMENAAIGEVENGINIESWILQELTAKKGASEIGEEEREDDTES